MINLEAETRCGYLITTEMKSVWNVQLKLLQKLLEACEKHDLKIWADSGTLIGTIRHKGYIPWDDDIDMIMMRDDYDKLISVCQDEFKDPYFLQTAYSEKAPYSHGHAQLRMNGTTGLLGNNIFMNIHLGIFIDIFVLDNVPEDNNEIRKMALSIMKFQSPLILRMQNKIIISKNIALLLKNILYRFMPIRIFKRRYKKMENFAKTYADSASKYVSPILLSQTPDFLMRCKLRKEWFSDTILLPFEDIMMPVPKGYHDILTHEYGDYMTPVKAPTMHGGFLAIDPDKDYTQYIPKLRRQARKHFINKLLNKNNSQ